MIRLSIVPPEIATGVLENVTSGQPYFRWFNGAGNRKMLKMRRLGVRNDGDETLNINTTGFVTGDSIPGGWIPRILKIELWDGAYAGPVLDQDKPWPVARASIPPGEANAALFLSWFPAWHLDITGVNDGRYTLVFSFDPKTTDAAGEPVAPITAAYPIILMNTDVFYLAIEPQAYPA